VGQELKISERSLEVSQVASFALNRSAFSSVTVAQETIERVRESHNAMMGILERGVAVYGVTTGFGDSSHRLIPPHQTETLQSNLVSYLLCGTGPLLPKEASRATLLIRLKSMSRGLSGVSPELISRMQLFLDRDWIPVVPREGSLGASGDLIPLAYLAQALKGEGKIHCGDQIRNTKDVLKENGIAPYVFKAKEGLALVNGTSSMAGLAVVNLNHAKMLTELACLATSWVCLSLKGRTESFEPLINEVAKSHKGQSQAARKIRAFLTEESYATPPNQVVGMSQSQIEFQVQERYSLRCAPQILGPVVDTLSMMESWLETEINSVSDNPLFSGEGQFATGGNFYGGYLSHGMDYMKICLANIADMIDRQLMLVIDDKTNRGLPANLAAWNKISVEERFLHHGLKGLHQAVNAITSEIMARTTPNSIFSRSSESHNQDKVSLGMSAAVSCSEMIEPLYTTMTMHLICLAQALDLRGVKLQGDLSRKYYDAIRSTIPFVDHDQALGDGIQSVKEKLQAFARGPL
jgi:phenylalanine ammonia-lyase